MSYTLETIFSIVSESVMLLNGKGDVKWIPEDDDGEKTPIHMDLPEFVLRSLAKNLIDGGEDAEEVRKVAEKYGVEIDTSPYFSVVIRS